MLSNLFSGRLLVSCVFALNSSPQTCMCTCVLYTHRHIQKSSVSLMDPFFPFVHIPLMVLHGTSHSHFLNLQGLEWMNTHLLCILYHLTNKSVHLSDTVCPLFNHPFSIELQEENGQAGRKVLHSLMHPPPSGKGVCYFSPTTQQTDENGLSSALPVIAIRNLVASGRPRQIASYSVRLVLLTGCSLQAPSFVCVVTGNMIEREAGGLSAWPSQDY